MELLPKDLIRFWIKVKKSNNCWEWTACLNIWGYGNFRFNKKTILSHRFSYQLFKGDIPNSLVLDHLCRNRKCVNPDHLEAVTLQENIGRGYWAQKTHCPKGHPYSGENLIKEKNGGRRCRTCHKKIVNENYKLKQNSLYRSNQN